jgi:hypothetical protein
VLLAAARRFALLTVSISGGTAALATLLGLATGTSLSRTISLGFYLVGAALLIGGFMIGNRGVLRPSRPHGGRFGRGVRRASGEETRENINLSVLLGVLGLILLAAGAAIDTRYELV